MGLMMADEYEGDGMDGMEWMDGMGGWRRRVMERYIDMSLVQPRHAVVAAIVRRS